jgi:hypothetical protein
MFGSATAFAKAHDAALVIRLPAASADTCWRKTRRVITLGASKSLRAVSARADAAQMIVAEDTGGVAIGESDLDGVIAHGGSSLSPSLGLKHGKCGRTDRASARMRALSDSFVIACGAWAFVAEIGEIIVTCVAVGPDNIDTRAAAHMHFYAGRLFAGINWDWHEF